MCDSNKQTGSFRCWRLFWPTGTGVYQICDPTERKTHLLRDKWVVKMGYFTLGTNMLIKDWIDHQKSALIFKSSLVTLKACVIFFLAFCLPLLVTSRLVNFLHSRHMKLLYNYNCASGQKFTGRFVFAEKCSESSGGFWLSCGGGRTVKEFPFQWDLPG